ncbi:MAG: hypothetical protein HQ566_05680 [Candidatus Omnitrophica bacterium]|nr:hypothetical protein [Candidatus Omnitrophota bacterium]
MPLKRHRFKKLIVAVSMIVAFLLTYTQDCVADSVSIKGAQKIHRMGGYVILINYETRDRWTDSLLFKVYCTFEKGEFTFASSSMNNLERGWHKTQIAISDVMKKRYGSLRKYKIDLYRNGILIDSRKSY